jgi:hypothetical protein
MQKLSALSDGIAKYLIVAILVIVPLYPKFPLLTVTGTYVAIRFEDLLMLALAAVVFVKVLPHFRIFLKDKIVRAFLIFFAVGLVSLLSGVFITGSVNLNLGILHLLRRFEYMIPFFAVISLFSGEAVSKNLNYYLKILLLVVFVTFIYGLGQRYLSFPVIITQNEEYSKGVALRWTPGSHINSTFAGHYDLASYLVIMLPVFITTLFLIKSRAQKIILAIVSGGGLWLLINSLSRIAQASYLFALAVSFLPIKKFKELGLVFLISLIFIATSSSLTSRFQRIIEVFSQKIGTVNYYVLADETILPPRAKDPEALTPTPIPVFEDRSVSIRLKVEWPRAVRAFTKNPLLGTGYSSINLATDNDYLRVLGETGILGFFAFWLVFISIGKEIFKAFPLQKHFSGIELGFMAGALGGIAATFVSAFFIDIFEASKLAITFWFILGYVVLMVRNKVYDKKY